MATPVRLGNSLIAWSLTNPNSCYPYLWSIDVVTGRSTLLKEISPLYDPVWSREPFVLQAGRLYFSARAPGDEATHLWSTDGTPEGTRQVQAPGEVGFDFPTALTSYAGHLYFFSGTSDNYHDTRFWRSDGTVDGTTQVEGVRGLPPKCISYEGGGGCGPSQPPVTMLGGRMIFVGLSPRYPNPSYALFSSDGTGKGTEFLRDFDFSYPYDIAKLGEVAYFDVESVYPVHGDQLWRTDGTRAGTWMVKDFCLGWCNSGILHPKAVGQTLYFSGWDGTRSSLWKSDGTTSGTIRLGYVSAGDREFRSVGDLVFFVGRDEEHGEEIWRTDGTSEGTRLIKDVRPGSEWSPPRELRVAGPYLFYFADDGVHGPALWRTDGTDSGTVLLKETPQAEFGSVYRPLVVFGDSVYFSAEDAGHGLELWRSDGTSAGTRPVADVYPGGESSDPFVIPAPDLSLLFLARGPEGVSIWETDGSAAGNRRIARIDSGAESRSSNPSLLNDVEGSLFFFTHAPCSCSPSDLWVSDGSEEGTIRLAAAHPKFVLSAGGSLYFNDYTSSGSISTPRFYRVDGRAQTMTKLADGEARNLTAVGDTVYFTMQSALWRVDPGRDELVLIKDSFGGGMLSSGGSLYIETGGNDPGLWKSDGTEAGTVRIHSGSVSHLTGAGGVVYFVQRESDGMSLWSTTPWSSGTTLVRRFSTGTQDPFDDTAGSRNVLYFLLRDGYRYRLWRSDGTDPGTYPLSETSAFGPLVPDSTGVYFIGVDPVRGSELWHTSGTPESTTRVKDIHPGPGSSSPADLKIVDGFLLFSADDGLHGRELWRSDGTEEGTYLLEDICPGACSSRPAGFTISGADVFFSANDGETGNELRAMPLSAINHPRENSFIPWRH